MQYVINFEFSNQLHNETVASCKLELAAINKNYKRREIKTSNAVFFQTERSCYIRFTVNKERWTVELGEDFIDSGFFGNVQIDEGYVYCNGEGPDFITTTPFTWDCFASFSTKSKRCNKRVDTAAVRAGLKPFIFTIGDGTLTKMICDEVQRTKKVKFGPSNHELIELPAIS